jgi:hypothetical protein
LEYRGHPGSFPVCDKLEPGAKFTVTLNFISGFVLATFLPDKPITTISGEPVGTNVLLLQIVCSYKSSLWPGGKQETFKFYAEPDTEGNFHWFPLGYGDPWVVTNAPVIPE